MKKNLMTVITMVLCLVNLVLTAVVVFAVVPEINNVNSLIAKVSEAIELDVKTGSDADGAATVSVDDQYLYKVNNGESMNINLKDSGDGKNHVAVVKVTVTMNKTSEKYALYGPDSENAGNYDDKYKSFVIQELSQFTIDELKENNTLGQDEIRDDLNSYFGDSSFIISVNYAEFMYE